MVCRQEILYGVRAASSVEGGRSGARSGSEWTDAKRSPMALRSLLSWPESYAHDDWRDHRVSSRLPDGRAWSGCERALSGSDSRFPSSGAQCPFGERRVQAECHRPVAPNPQDHGRGTGAKGRRPCREDLLVPAWVLSTLWSLLQLHGSIECPDGRGELGCEATSGSTSPNQG